MSSRPPFNQSMAFDRYLKLNLAHRARTLIQNRSVFLSAKRNARGTTQHLIAHHPRPQAMGFAVVVIAVSNLYNTRYLLRLKFSLPESQMPSLTIVVCLRSGHFLKPSFSAKIKHFSRFTYSFHCHPSHLCAPEGR